MAVPAARVGPDQGLVNVMRLPLTAPGAHNPSMGSDATLRVYV
ncbi:MAG: hypothetical protein ACK5OB_18685 [Pirellula sp.]